jgi:hypothetical protein
MPRTHARPLHHVTVGRTREVRGPDALERGFVGVIIVAVISIGAVFGARAVRMSDTLDAVSLASGIEAAAVVHYAVHGRWPAANDTNVIGKHVEGTYATHAALGNDGVITVDMALDAARAGWPKTGFAAAEAPAYGKLSFRPELLGTRDAPTITYLCGYEKPVAGAVAEMAANPTTLARDDLPPLCR